jgi:hypothetical protein
LSGTGTLAGTLFTIDSGSLEAAQIAPNHVIALAAPVDGCFPVLKIESDTSLTLSVMYDQLDPTFAEGSPEAVSPGEGTGLNFHIRTFWPQRMATSREILMAAGVAEADIGQITNPQALVRPCVLGTLFMIFTALASGAEDAAALLNRAQLYERLYQRAVRNTVIEIDSDGDGLVDERRSLAVVQLRRA